MNEISFNSSKDISKDTLSNALFPFLNKDELVRAQLVSKKWNEAAKAKGVWGEQLTRFNGSNSSEVLSSKELYENWYTGNFEKQLSVFTPLMGPTLISTVRVFGKDCYHAYSHSDRINIINKMTQEQSKINVGEIISHPSQFDFTPSHCILNEGNGPCRIFDNRTGKLLEEIPYSMIGLDGDVKVSKIKLIDDKFIIFQLLGGLRIFDLQAHQLVWSPHIDLGAEGHVVISHVGNYLKVLFSTRHKQQKHYLLDLQQQKIHQFGVHDIIVYTDDRNRLKLVMIHGRRCVGEERIILDISIWDDYRSQGEGVAPRNMSLELPKKQDEDITGYAYALKQNLFVVGYNASRTRCGGSTVCEQLPAIAAFNLSSGKRLFHKKFHDWDIVNNKNGIRDFIIDSLYLVDNQIIFPFSCRVNGFFSQKGLGKLNFNIKQASSITLCSFLYNLSQKIKKFSKEIFAGICRFVKRVACIFSFKSVYFYPKNFL